MGNKNSSIKLSELNNDYEKRKQVENDLNLGTIYRIKSKERNNDFIRYFLSDPRRGDDIILWINCHTRHDYEVNDFIKVKSTSDDAVNEILSGVIDEEVEKVATYIKESDSVLLDNGLRMNLIEFVHSFVGENSLESRYEAQGSRYANNVSYSKQTEWNF
ncbi:MAG: hypothetical protein LBR43_03290 [Spiroplasmataceae bacterium]|nr:hypothetical protein [Spiroplasmataceae bacterium]